jgi:hypothetical protein
LNLSLALPVLALTGALAAPPAAEDLTLVWKVSAEKGAPGSRTQYITSNRMRSSEGEKDFIADLQAGKITMIDHKKKQYSETTMAELEAAMQKAGDRMRAASVLLQDAVARMPPEMQKRLGQGAAPGLAVSVTMGGTRRIAGYEAQQYTLSLGDVLSTEMWNTKELPLPVQDPGQFRKLAAIGLPQVNGMDKVFGEMKKIEGLSLAQTTRSQVLGQTTTTTSEVTEVRRTPIPPSTFDVAAIAPGYARVESPLARLGQAPPGS